MQRVVSHRDTAVLHLKGGEGGGSRPHAYECEPASDMHQVGHGLTWGWLLAVPPPLVLILGCERL